MENIHIRTSANLPFDDYYRLFVQVLSGRKGVRLSRSPNHAWAVRCGSRGPLLAVLSGLHGDETGGPLGLLQWVTERPDPLISKGYQLWMLPLANDSGWDGRVREWNGLDLNRSFQPGKGTPDFLRWVMRSWKRRPPDVFLDFHEDPEYQGNAYLFRYTKELHDLPERMAAELGLDILDWTDWAEWEGCDEFYLRRLDVTHCVTIETPGSLPFDRRANWVRQIMDWTIEYLTGMRV